MSTPKELRNRFSTQDKPSGVTTNVSELLGLTIKDMEDTIVSDIAAMIEKGYRAPLEGYILCLSRIMKHETAWNHIVDAFRQQNEEVPKRYYPYFGRNLDEKPPPPHGVTVK